MSESIRAVDRALDILLCFTNQTPQLTMTHIAEQVGIDDFLAEALPQDKVQQVFRQQGAALVLFYPFCAPRNQAWLAERMAQVDNLTRGLTTAAQSREGAIYFYP